MPPQRAKERVDGSTGVLFSCGRNVEHVLMIHDSQSAAQGGADVRLVFDVDDTAQGWSDIKRRSAEAKRFRESVQCRDMSEGRLDVVRAEYIGASEKTTERLEPFSDPDRIRFFFRCWAERSLTSSVFNKGLR